MRGMDTGLERNNGSTVSLDEYYALFGTLSIVVDFHLLGLDRKSNDLEGYLWDGSCRSRNGLWLGSLKP